MKVWDGSIVMISGINYMCFIQFFYLYHIFSHLCIQIGKCITKATINNISNGLADHTSFGSPISGQVLSFVVSRTFTVRIMQRCKVEGMLSMHL